MLPIIGALTTHAQSKTTIDTVRNTITVAKYLPNGSVDVNVYDAIHPIDSSFWFYFRYQMPYEGNGGGSIMGDIIEHIPIDSLIKWTPKHTLDSIIKDYYLKN